MTPRRGAAVKAAAIRSRGAAIRVLVRGHSRRHAVQSLQSGSCSLQYGGSSRDSPYPGQTVLMNANQEPDALVAQALAAIRSMG